MDSSAEQVSKSTKSENLVNPKDLPDIAVENLLPKAPFSPPVQSRPRNEKEIAISNDEVLWKSESTVALDWVGMDAIEIPLRIPVRDDYLLTVAKVRAQVSLDLAASRGIHMSRLYSLIQTNLAGQMLSIPHLVTLVREFLNSHLNISSAAKIEVSYQLPVLRYSLKSKQSAIRSYPTFLQVIQSGLEDVRVIRGFEVLYSSTCPASAALARQLIREKFDQDFGGRQDSQGLVSMCQVAEWIECGAGLYATPHSQRSKAIVQLRYAGDQLNDDFVENQIDLVETALQTPVQTLVKRQDEQEFARLNGQNLLFCEDAARRIVFALESLGPQIAGYFTRVEHFESLHPHNAVAEKSKNWSISSY